MTVLEVIQRSTPFLAGKGVEAARLQTELLLAHLLKLPRMQLYLNFERVLSTAEVDQFRELIKRRSQREPLQQIVGSVCFCGLEIAVNRRVLVPRPETELLAEHGWTFLKSLCTEGAAQPVAFDLGTGSGCIAIALAALAPASKVFAADISADAIELAKANAQANKVAERTVFIRGDCFEAMAQAGPVNLLITNPPYIPSADIATLEPEVRDFEPREALDGGPDGLDFFRRIATQAGPALRPQGKLMIEFGDGQAEPLRKIFSEQNWIVEAIAEDYNHQPRILIASVSKGAA